MSQRSMSTAIPTSRISVRGLMVPSMAVTYVVAAMLTTEAVANGLVICPLRLCFGVHCPGCGSIRSLVALMDGRFEQAAALNPFVVVAAICLPVALTVCRRFPAETDRAGYLFLGAWVSWGALRMITEL